MSLSDSQKTTIASWLAKGDSLSDVQTKLKSEFDISMTFMEVRFLIDDLDLEIAKPEKPEEPEQQDEAPNEPEAVEGVAVDVDAIVTPGSLVSGSVTFNDGVTAKWQLDQMGRLGLSDIEEGYQPSAEDVQEFQQKLKEELEKKGFA